MSTMNFDFSAASASNEDNYTPNGLGIVSQNLPAEYSFIAPEGLVGTSSPFLDIMSELQDNAGKDAVHALIGLMTSVQPSAWRSVASSLARAVASNVSVEQYNYVPKEARGKQSILVKPLSHTAPIGQALLAARLHNILTNDQLGAGWSRGRNESVASVPGGFPTPDVNADAADVIAEFLKTLKHASVIGGRPNPVTAQTVEVIKTNFVAISKQKKDTFGANLVKFSNAFHPMIQDAVGKAITQFIAVPSSVRDSYDLAKDDDRKIFTAEVLKYRAMAREALKTGRTSRGEDNIPFLSTPYYRLSGALKSVNRLHFVVSITGGKIATTTSSQVSQAFGATDDGWHVYMDCDIPFDQLMTRLTGSKHVDENGVLAPKVLVQVNVLEEDGKTNPQKLFNFLIANRVMFGWAIHDGRLFVTSTNGYPCTSLPKVFSMIAALNWVRTLHCHVPTLPVEINNLPAWYGKFDKVPIPQGSFTGVSMELDFERAVKQRVDQ